MPNAPAVVPDSVPVAGPSEGFGPTAASIFLFRATRQAMSHRWAIATFVLIASVFALLSMLMGGMLVFARTGVQSIQVYVITSGGEPWWTYPGIIIDFPNGALLLPLLATIMMIFVSVGVGIGLTVAIYLWSRLILQRRTPSAQSVAASTAAGLTPAFLALATIGACCGVTASTATGLGVVSNASGANVFTLLANNWYLWVFQLAVLAIALIAHEALLQTYGPLLGIRTDYPTPTTTPLSVPLRRTILAFLARLALLLGGLTWALAGAALFATYGYPTSSAAFWFAFLVQHELVGVVAVFIAIMPDSARSAFRRVFGSPAGWALRAGLLVAGVSLLAWLPPTVLGTGAEGLFNELFGLAGLPAAVGAIAPPFYGPVALFLRLAGQFGFLGLGAVLLAIWPEWSIGLVLPSPPLLSGATRGPVALVRTTTEPRGGVSLASGGPAGATEAPAIEGQ